MGQYAGQVRKGKSTYATNKDGWERRKKRESHGGMGKEKIEVPAVS